MVCVSYLIVFGRGLECLWLWLGRLVLTRLFPDFFLVQKEVFLIKGVCSFGDGWVCYYLGVEGVCSRI